MQFPLPHFMVNQPLVQIWHAPRRLLIVLLTAYQQTLSPDHGPLKGLYPYGYCRHEPTCSQYGKEVLEKRGVVIGLILLIGRVLTCHPWKKPSEEKIQKTIKGLLN